MDALTRTFAQFRSLFTAMSPSQRITLLVLPVLIVGAFGFLMLGDSRSSYVPLSWGKTFTSAHLDSVEQALIEAGLGDFRREGTRLLVPADEVDRYNAALIEKGQTPANWGAGLAKKISDDAGYFPSSEKLQLIKDEAIRQELQRVIREIEDVENADVFWTASKPRTIRARTRVTATVFIKPKGNRELSRRLVQSLQSAVASMLDSNMKPDDVVVLDKSTGRSFSRREDEDGFDNTLLAQIHEFEQSYQQRIADALPYIDGVLIAVNVDLDNIRKSVVREQNIDPKKTVPLQQIEESKELKSTGQTNAAALGALPNMPRSLEIGGGMEQSQSTLVASDPTVSAPTFTITENVLIGAMPKAVQVSVGIPEEYYRGVFMKDKGPTEGMTAHQQKKLQTDLDAALPAIKTDVNEKVQRTVLKAIGTGSTADAVTVVSYTRIETATELPPTEWTATIGRMVSKWGGAAGLALFAAWVLWMLNRSMTKLPDAGPESDEVELMGVKAERKPVEEETGPSPLSQRDELQLVVRDNPEMAAAVLAKWLQAAK